MFQRGVKTSVSLLGLAIWLGGGVYAQATQLPPHDICEIEGTVLETGQRDKWFAGYDAQGRYVEQLEQRPVPFVTIRLRSRTTHEDNFSRDCVPVKEEGQTVTYELCDESEVSEGDEIRAYTQYVGDEFSTAHCLRSVDVLPANSE